MKVAITGSTGLVGTAIINAWQDHDIEITRIIREGTDSSYFGESYLKWNIKKHNIDLEGLDGHDVIIHLAGANIAGNRWTKGYKKLLWSSRVESTTLLSNAISKLRFPPKLLLCASAIGYYGPHNPEINVDEASPSGKDFLSGLCDHWEKSTEVVEKSGIRVVHMRLGVVLSTEGGALEQMLLPFKLGLGGKLGSGDQMFSWVALKEIPLIVEHLMEHEEISGPINLVSPNAVSNKDFTRALGQALKRPTIFPVPAFGARLLFGEMADALLLQGADVKPRRLEETGYQFKYPRIADALKVALNGD